MPHEQICSAVLTDHPAVPGTRLLHRGLAQQVFQGSQPRASKAAAGLQLLFGQEDRRDVAPPGFVGELLGDAHLLTSTSMQA